VKPPGFAVGSASAPAIRLERLTHRFPARRHEQVGETLALDAVNLEIPEGACLGVLGPNGAGKTTLLRVISTLLRASSGLVRVLGEDPLARPEAIRRRLGAVLGGDRSVYWRLTGRENLLYAAALCDLPAADASARAAELLRLTDLVERADDLVERYSTGMRQRLALARALVPDPPLLVLDEPTSGLDPQAAAAMRRLLERLRDDRTRTIVIATHNMIDAERLCDLVGILDRGRLVACAAPSALKAQHRRAAGPDAPEPSLEAVFLALTGRVFSSADATS
jgi:ABC-2 type transport system ATP-binding protein